jgi:DNA-binding LytR/AlgR family response regulator
MKLKCLIIDDEPIARKVLKNHAAKLENVEIVAECSDAIETINFLTKHKIDVLFLDIEMPEMSGMDFLKSNELECDVVLTTAYSDYAVESYNFEVKDYLLKPISFPRFTECIQKLQKERKVQLPTDAAEQNIIFLKSDKKTYRFQLDKILYFQGYGNYLKVFLKDRKDAILILEKISELEKRLMQLNFQRTHKSFLVNINNIEVIEGNRIFMNDHEIPISKSYKQDITDKMNF